MKPCSEIKVGDVIVFLSTAHLITEIEPYTHPTLGPTFGVARDATGWGITLMDPTCLEVAS